jgi:phosphoribosylformylglycinamidine cyclo-ligase
VSDIGARSLMSPGISYRDAGVNVRLKQELLTRIAQDVSETRRPEVVGELGGFGGMFRLSGVGDPVLVASCDSVGTKLRLADLLDSHESVGADLVNHCVNDIAVMGAEPLFYLDYFGTGRLDPTRFQRVIAGTARACRENGIALLGGETAELPGLYAGTDYDLVGFAVGVCEHDAILEPSRAREGDVLLGFASSGLHTNGYSLARACVARESVRTGRDPRVVLGSEYDELGGRTLGAALLEVHRSYLPDIRELRRRGGVRSIAHITGGGWEGNLPRALPEGLGAVVERTWEVPPVFRLLQRMGEIEEREMWDTFNMGIGLVAIVGADAARDGALRIGTVETSSGARRVRLA